jgi:molybdopterin-binding protein
LRGSARINIVEQTPADMQRHGQFADGRDEGTAMAFPFKLSNGIQTGKPLEWPVMNQFSVPAEGMGVMISARNQIRGKVISLKTGSVMSEVIVDIGGGNEIVSLISASSAKRLKLKKGREVRVVIKSTEVMISIDDE